MLKKRNTKTWPNNGLIAPIMIISFLMVIFSLPGHCWAGSDYSSEQDEVGIYSGKITRVADHNHMPRWKRSRPDLERKAIVVGTEKFYITTQTSWVDSTENPIDENKVTLKEGDEVLLKYNEQTNEILEIRLEGMIKKENRPVTVANPKSGTLPKQKIIYRNGVYKNVYVK